MEQPEARGQIQQWQKHPQPWGKLIRLGVEEAEPHILLLKKEWTIGRKKGCDLSFPGNKLVSGEHCKIIVDEESGQVSLEDTSTNGTVINKQKVVKKQISHLHTGDVIYVVYRKHEPENNVAYLYESLNSKQDQADEPVEACIENPCQVTKDTSNTGRNRDGTSDPPAAPSPTSCDEPQPSTSKSDLFSPAATSALESVPTEQENPSTSGLHSSDFLHASTLPPLPPHGPEATLEYRQPGVNATTPAVSSGDKLKQVPPVPVLQSRDERDAFEPLRKKMKVDGGASPSLPTLPPMACAAKAGSDGGKLASEKPDKMEETLTCIICQELLHDCVSLQPCMHTFCAACYSGWMERSSLCPTCRCPVERICKNHILNNLVEAYLIQHPEKCRSEEDVRSMDARNKISQDMLQPKVRRSFSDEEGSSEDLLELSDVDSESSDISQPYIVCRQCPGYRRQSVLALSSSSVPEGELETSQSFGDAPSTSSNFPKAAQEYVCPPQGSHVICTCCFQPMPDRRAEREQNPHVGPQQCTICLQSFCHLYWGCTRVSCLGCLAPFCEINLGDKCLDGVLNGNNYESDILKDYLASRGLTWKNVLNDSLLALQRGVFVLPDYRITGETVLCYCCSLRSFRELAYQYRQNIPTAELPVAVTSRPDCYWGRNCRTQVKAHHAMKFNHICEQTRFKN